MFAREDNHILKHLPAILTIACGLASMQIFAAENGTLGEESSGYVSISLKIEQGVQITNLENWDLTVSRNEAGSDYQFVRDFCVQGTIGSRISVSAHTSIIVGNRFALSSEDNEAMPFVLEFNPRIASGEFEEVAPNNGSSVYSISSFNDCNAGNNSEIRIVFEEEDIMSATSFEFAGDLFLTVELL